MTSQLSRSVPLRELVVLIERYGLCAAFGMLDGDDEKKIGPVVLRALQVANDVAIASVSETSPLNRILDLWQAYSLDVETQDANQAESYDAVTEALDKALEARRAANR